MGLSQALAVTYLHLPKIFCENLFLRFVHVLEHHYECLLDPSMPEYCSVQQEKSARTSCVDHWVSLVQLFRAVEKTFRRQLFIQQAFMMGSLIFGIYLSISFVISSSAGWNCSHLLFTAGFMLYSLVPAVRLLVTADYVDRLMVKMNLTR
jgi:hypothetical protein